MDNIYQLIGMIIEKVQNIEYNLCQKIKYSKLLYLFERHKNVSPYLFEKVEKETKELIDHLSNMSFGQIIGIVRKFDALSSGDIEYLESILSKRNQLVHSYFKNNELNHSSDEVKIKYLNNVLNDVTAFNSYLIDLLEEAKSDLNEYIL